MIRLAWGEKFEGRMQMQGLATYADIHDIEYPTFTRTVMWITMWKNLISPHLPFGTNVTTPLGTYMYDGRDLHISLFSPAQFDKYKDMTMLTIAIINDVELHATEQRSFAQYRAYYIVTHVKDVQEEHEVAVKLLDAAANSDGYANIKGVGNRTKGTGEDVYYYIEASYVGL